MSILNGGTSDVVVVCNVIVEIFSRLMLMYKCFIVGLINGDIIVLCVVFVIWWYNVVENVSMSYVILSVVSVLDGID